MISTGLIKSEFATLNELKPDELSELKTFTLSLTMLPLRLTSSSRHIRKLKSSNHLTANITALKVIRTSPVQSFTIQVQSLVRLFTVLK